MSKQSHIHWQAPFLILGFLVTGVLLSVGHHLFYLSLDGSVVSAHGFKLFGSNHSQQQLDLVIGTTFSFLVRACFALSVSTAYYQIFWKMLRRATHDSKSARLDRIDDAFSATGNIVAMCNVPLWLTQPLLFLAASTAWLLPIPSVITPGTLSVNLESRADATMQHVPQLDFTTLNFVSTIGRVGPTPYIDGSTIHIYQYNGPSESLKQIAMDVAYQDSILPIRPPSTNSSWDLAFHGPRLTCTNVSSEERLSIEKNIKQYVKQSSCSATPVPYLSWFTHYWDHPDRFYETPYINFSYSGAGSTGPLAFDADSIFGLASLSDRSVFPMPTLYVAVLPGMLTPLFYNLLAEEDCSFNASNSGITKVSPLGRAGNNATILRCDLTNSTYTTKFAYVDGVQSISYTASPEVESKTNLVTELIAKVNSSCEALQISPSEPPCIFDSSILNGLAYQAGLQSFSTMLTGTLLYSTIWGEGIIDNSSVRSTALMYTKELGFLRDDELQNANNINFYSNGLQAHLSHSETPWIKYASGTSFMQKTRAERLLKNAIEDLFQKFTLSLMSLPNLHPDFSATRAPPMTNVTTHSFKTVYVYAWKRLWIAYGLATLFTLAIAALGILAIILNRASYDDTFSTILRASRNAELSVEILPGAMSAESPLPSYLKKATFTMPPPELAKQEHSGLLPVSGGESRARANQGPAVVSNELRKSSLTW